nr:hypothetical protein [Candidatus Saccharibacteria bacterium]
PLYPVHHVEAHVYANFIVQSGGAHPSTLLRNEFEAAVPPPKAHLSARADMNARESLDTSSDKTSAARDSSGNADDESRSEAVLKDDGDEKTNRLNLPSSQPDFPMLALIVSGGHSQLVLFKNHGDYHLLGQTQDDAVGEAFDKVAKLLGLPYPGGPSIAEAADYGDPQSYQLPIAKLSDPYNFSFSGLKTAVLRAVQREVGVETTFPSHELKTRLTDVQRHNFAASFQHTAIRTLVATTLRAVNAHQPASVVIAGGVAANQELRRQLADQLPFPIEYAPISLCTDNGAMIACLGYYMAQTLSPTDPTAFTVMPSLPMSKTAWHVT